MLSRVASSIYWMSRYLERADNVARLIDVNARLILDMDWERQSTQWAPLVRATGDEDDFEKRYATADEKNVLKFLTFDNKNPNSILSCIQWARENARTIREVINSEVWASINSLFHLVEKHSRKRRIDDLQEFFNSIRIANNLITGLIENTMSHDEGWHFARIGKMLERADKTARMLDVKYFYLLPGPDYINSPYDKVEWGAVLKSASGFEMYLKKFHIVDYRNVTKFLIFDIHFPRAIQYCVNTMVRSLGHITQMLDVNVKVTNEVEILRASLTSAKIDTVLQNGLHEFIDVLQINLNIIHQALDDSFFSPKVSAAPPSHLLTAKIPAKKNTRENATDSQS